MDYLKLKFYFELSEMQHIINVEILPLADQTGVTEEDAGLIKIAEKFSREIERHLSERDIQVSKKVSQFRKNTKS